MAGDPAFYVVTFVKGPFSPKRVKEMKRKGNSKEKERERLRRRRSMGGMAGVYFSQNMSNK